MLNPTLTFEPFPYEAETGKQGSSPAGMSVIDSRIDVSAQKAILRMMKGDPNQKTAGSQLLTAIKSGQLAGIYGDDLRAAADLARRLGTVRWQIVPKGQDAALVLDPQAPDTAPPTVIFRGDEGKEKPNGVRGNPKRLDPALVRVWRTFIEYKTGNNKCKLLTGPARLVSGRAPLIRRCGDVGGAGNQCWNDVQSCTTNIIGFGGKSVIFEAEIQTISFNGRKNGDAALDPSQKKVRFSSEGVVLPGPDCGVKRVIPAWHYKACVKGLGPGLRSETGWEFGFIQNVLTYRFTAVYTDGSMRGFYIEKCLDCVPNAPRPWNSSFSRQDLAPISSHDPSGKTISEHFSAEIEDNPAVELFVTHPGNNQALLTKACMQGTFGIWLVVHQKSKSSYIPLCYKEIRLARMFASSNNGLDGWKFPIIVGGQKEVQNLGGQAKYGNRIPKPITTGSTANELIQFRDIQAGSCSDSDIESINCTSTNTCHLVNVPLMEQTKCGTDTVTPNLFP